MENIEEQLKASVAKVDAMTPAERAEMFRLQRESWVRAEMNRPKPKFKFIDGVKVYDSYEDYVAG